MALEAVVCPQSLFSYGYKDMHTSSSAYNYGFGVVREEEEEGEEDKETRVDCELSGSNALEKVQGFNDLHPNWDSFSSSIVRNFKEWELNFPEACSGNGVFPVSFPVAEPLSAAAAATRRKRRRTKSCKNKEEVENQRMTHIAVERNRRKQMNEYLSVLRSLMPESYVQRGDQASIVGGAINFVKELEQLLQSLEAQTQIKQRSDPGFSPPFANLSTFHQHSSRSIKTNLTNETMAENRSSIADIEVTMVESHANLKIVSRRRLKQLLKIVTGFQSLCLTILHLNVTAMDQMVLYSFSVKLEDDCQLNSVDEIATTVYQMLGRIEEEADVS